MTTLIASKNCGDRKQNYIKMTLRGPLYAIK